MFYHSSIGATANLLLSAQRNAFSLTSSTCKKLNNDERSVTKVLLKEFSNLFGFVLISKSSSIQQLTFNKICHILDKSVECDFLNNFQTL